MTDIDMDKPNLLEGYESPKMPERVTLYLGDEAQYGDYHDFRLTLQELTPRFRWGEAEYIHADLAQQRVMDTAKQEALDAVKAAFDGYRFMSQDADKYIAVLEAALMQPSVREGDYSAWLIELKGSTPQYYMGDWDDTWTRDHDQALHFSRKSDAEKVISAYGWTEAFASEHGWPDVKARVIAAAPGESD